LQSLKEKLYLIIDSRVKELYAGRDEFVIPADDLILRETFRWASVMRVPGAQMVWSRLAPGVTQADLPSTVPSAFNLTLNGSYLTLSASSPAWSATFPYHFMVADLRDFETSNGQRTLMSIVSTGFGRHNGDGASQATLMLISSSGESPEAFSDFWLQGFGFDGEVTSGDNLPDGFASYRRFDAETKLHYEVLFPDSRKSLVAVAYLGIDGTYQWNRPHFLNFLKNLVYE
jgi:hypothetical protein